MRIIAGIVTFNPELNLLEKNINSIITQVDNLIIVDNSSNNIDDLLSLTSKIDNKILVIKNNENLGIATALNQIMNYAFENKIEWVLTLDQDSISPNNIILEYKKYLTFKKVAIISPNIFDRNIGYIKSKEIDDKNYVYVKNAITSAALTNVAVWKEIGEFDDILFIDYVDFEYCERVLANGYFIMKVNNVILNHEIGNSKIIKTVFGNYTVQNHNKYRKYYIARNLVYLSTKGKRVKIKKLLSVAKLTLKTFIFEKQKKEKIQYIFQGIIDGTKMTKKKGI